MAATAAAAAAAAAKNKKKIGFTISRKKHNLVHNYK